MPKKRIANESFETSQARTVNFVALYYDMLDSPAWAKLTAKDKDLYLRLRRKYQRKVTKGIVHESNRNDISMPKAEYRSFMHQETFEKSIDRLIELGFVKLVQNRYETRECNIYGFSDMWQNYGTKDFKIKPEHRRTLRQQLDSKREGKQK